MGVFGAVWQTTLQQHVPEEALSRVSAWDWMGSSRSCRSGSFSPARCPSAIGISTTLWISVGYLVVSTLAVLLVPSVRNLRRLDEPEPKPEAALSTLRRARSRRSVAELSRDDVLAAREAIAGRLHRTPVFSSATLGERAGAPVHLKAELFQRTGSFKPRGVLTKLASLSTEEKRRGVIGISAGNHAQALAYCAALEGIDALIVMWQGASDAEDRGDARVRRARSTSRPTGPAEAFERLAELMEETGRALVHPFDDPFTIAGQGTVGLEILEDVPGRDRDRRPRRRGRARLGHRGRGGGAAGRRRRAGAVRCPQPRASRPASRYRSSPRSMADGLSAPFAGEHAIRICQALGVESVLVSEDELADGMRFLYGRAKLACEPAAAAGVAALLAGKVAVEPGDTVVAVVSGGNVVPEIASAILSSNEAGHPS